MEFFALEENQAILRRFKLALEEQPEIEPPVVAQLKNMLPFFINNPQVFDQYCQYNTKWLGESLFFDLNKITSRIHVATEDKSETLLDIFVWFYSFICELDFSRPGNLSFELSGIINFVGNNIEKFTGSHKLHLFYAQYRASVQILKQLLNEPELSNFKSFEETAKKADSMKKDWDAQLAQMSGEVKRWQEKLEELKTDSNFVALDQGFHQLATTKKRERWWSRAGMGLLGLVMLLPLIYELWFVTRHIDEVAKNRDVLLYTLPALTGLELLLLYWFRVVLSNVRSLNTQLVQIELRRSLCQFIQSYADYSSKIKEKDKSALEKFESLIFSGIISETGAIPTTFDGVDQLAKLVSSLRSGKAG